MLQIIGQPLLAYLYLLLTTYPRLAGALALFVLVVLGAVIIRAFSRIRRGRQEVYNNMAVSDAFPDPAHLAGAGGGGSRQVKTSSATSTTSTTATAPVAPVAPITPVLAPVSVTRTSSSSTSSSDLLLPLPINTNINRRSSSWPPLAPIPWRSSWGFLDEDQVVVLEEEDEDTPTEQGQCRVQEPQHEAISSNVDEASSNNNNNFLALPPTGPSRRTGSMEARKGSACTISGLEDIHGLQRLDLGILVPHTGGGDGDRNDDAGSPADLVGVGGQFLL